MRIGDLATARAGDKGATLDIGVVARDAAAYELLAAQLTADRVGALFGAAPGASARYEVPGVDALKFVVPEVLGGGTYTSLRAGVHWQKAAASAVLELELTGRPRGDVPFHVRPPGWIGARAGPEAFVTMRDWVLRAEALSFDGVFLGDRLLPAAVGSESSADSVYGATMLEVTTTLAALAQATERIVLGPLVLVLPYRHPLALAKTVATLDLISGGRVVLGAGIGWNEIEFAALGIDRRRRGALFERALADCRALWRGETVCSGDDDDDGGRPAALAPLPAQDGGPPVWIASFSPGSALDWAGEPPPGARRALERVGRMADGWVPLVYSASGRRRLDPAVLGRAHERVLDAAAAVGRGRDDVDMVHSDWVYVIEDAADEARCREALGGFFSGSWAQARATYVIGSADEVAERLAEQTAAVDRVDAYVLTPLGSDPGQLDALCAVRAQLRRRAVAAA